MTAPHRNTSARARRLYMALRFAGNALTVQQYRTIRGWITAGQYDSAECAMRKRGLLWSK